MGYPGHPPSCSFSLPPNTRDRKGLGEVMPDFGPMRRAVSFALRFVPEGWHQKADTAAIALLRRYADIIDQADALDSWAPELRHLVAAAGGDERAQAAGKAVARALQTASAAGVTSDLGPKFLAVLTALQLTPAGRPGQAPNGGGTSGGSVAQRTYAELRQRRVDRAKRAGTHRT